MYHIFFTHSSVDGHLGYYHVLGALILKAGYALLVYSSMSVIICIHPASSTCISHSTVPESHLMTHANS